MGKFSVTFFVLLITVCFFKATVYAESAPVPEPQAKEIAVEEKGAADLNVPESESQEPLNVELEVNFINDPLQPYNRSIFVFNDKMYYYFMKPVSNGYKTVVHEKARLSIRNFLSNIRMPVRFVNCVLQGKIEGASTELARFVINSIFGLGGFFDPASSSELNLKKYNEDFGQTLAKYGIG
ncbi:MAG TPA: MlaA family lipoprotein, partial [Candidatus Wujingus californicus]